MSALWRNVSDSQCCRATSACHLSMHWQHGAVKDQVCISLPFHWLACDLPQCQSFAQKFCSKWIVDSTAFTDPCLDNQSTSMVKCIVPRGQELYPETQSKELRLGSLLLEGTHALHGVGHHGDSSWSHLSAAPRIYQSWVSTCTHRDSDATLDPQGILRGSSCCCFLFLYF